MAQLNLDGFMQYARQVSHDMPRALGYTVRAQVTDLELAVDHFNNAGLCENCDNKAAAWYDVQTDTGAFARCNLCRRCADRVDALWVHE